MFIWIKRLLILSFVVGILTAGSFAGARMKAGKIVGNQRPLGGRTTAFAFKGVFVHGAKASAGILHVFGYEDMHRDGQALVSPRGAITVGRGCDAVAPTALFLSAVIASPIVLRSRLIAVGAGTVLLMLMNLFRIITLYLCAVHWRAAFDIMHLDVWQTLFILERFFSSNKVSNTPLRSSIGVPIGSMP